ncbi:MAG: polyprenyl synthetase family protein [Caulobacteraceae bacterium]|nr:polyprenyl synthetase family protein [Caulobacteraceae bacterium]
MRDSLDQRVAEAADLVTVALDALLPRADGPEQRLTEAMRYAALGPGRRMRPFFMLETARMFGVEERSVLRAACALECVHAYSQVHDDLPCLDDDDLRRGRPTLHRAYDEATAILAGDGLQAVAFEIMAHPDTHSDGTIRAELVRRLAVACGAKGMVGGQMIAVVGVGDDLGAIARMQRMKTGALIACAFDLALVLGRAPESERQALVAFAQDLGLAYQIVDDFTDAAGEEDLLGKAAAERNGAGRKVNFVTLLGVDAARERVDLLAAQAKAHLDMFGDDARYLRNSVDFVLDRRQ